MSISLGDATCLALGTSNGWEKMKKVEIIAMAKEAEDDASYRDCQSLGSQSVGGVEALGYGFLHGEQVRALRAQAGQRSGLVPTGLYAFRSRVEWPFATNTTMSKRPFPER